jgi:hypothetical protein
MLRVELLLKMPRITLSLPSPFKGEGLFFVFGHESPRPLRGRVRKGGGTPPFSRDLAEFT